MIDYSASPHVTECFLINPTAPAQVMLGRKRRGLGAGKIVGIGGHIEQGETPLTAAIRELHEETRVHVRTHDLQLRGWVDFRFPNKPSYCMLAHIFVATTWQGEPILTDEIEPVWFNFDAIPFDEMWADARYWLCDVLRGGKVNAIFTFNDDNATIKSCQFFDG
jgi:8-oxo-dGTP diphosphatase